jgi:hypothetical protein
MNGRPSMVEPGHRKTSGTATVRWVEKVEGGVEVIFELADDPDLLRQVEIATGEVGAAVRTGDQIVVTAAGPNGPYELERVLERDGQPDGKAAS